jgi:hypothetical protein
VHNHVDVYKWWRSESDDKRSELNTVEHDRTKLKALAAGFSRQWDVELQCTYVCRRAWNENGLSPVLVTDSVVEKPSASR